MEGGMNKFFSVEEETAALLQFSDATSPNIKVVAEARVTKFAQFSRTVEIKNCLSLSSHESAAIILISLEDIV